MRAAIIGAVAFGGVIMAAFAWSYIDRADPTPEQSGGAPSPELSSVEQHAGAPVDGGTARGVAQPTPPRDATPSARPAETEAASDDRVSDEVADPREPTSTSVTSAAAPRPEESAGAAPDRLAAIAPGAADPAPSAAPAVRDAEQPAPSFDLVRVDADGQTVIAGRSRPNERVEVLLDGDVVETVLADAAGRFVAIVTADLSTEARELRLRVTLPEQPRPGPPAAGPGLPSGDGSDGAPVPSGTGGTPDRSAGGPSALPGPVAPEAHALGASPAEQNRLAEQSATATGFVDKAEPAAPGVPESRPAAPGDAASAPGSRDASASASGEPRSTGKEASELVPEVADEVTALDEPGVGTEAAGGSPAGPPGRAANRTLAALPGRPATTSGTAPAAGEPTPAASGAGRRHLLSEPVIILPAERLDGAPALVQPQGEELALLQPAETEADSVVLDQLTKDPDGRVLLRGRAQPGHAVRVYGNGRLIDTVTVREGSWGLALTGDRAAGIQLFRFDEIGRAGEVTSRIEMPFAPSGAAEQVVRDRRITVQRGDNLWRIAEQHYGEGIRYSVIFGANSDLIRDPDLIYPDQVFTIPELVEAE